MKSRIIIAALAAVSFALVMQACSRPLPPQASCAFVQNPEQQRVSWKARLPVKLYIHNSVPINAYSAIDRAVDVYNKTVGGGKEILKIAVRGADGALDPRKDGNSMIYWFDTWDPHKTTEQARTTIYWSGVQIFEADVRINAKDFKYYLGDSESFADLDLTSLLVHEFGHALGLAHNNSNGSVMNLSLDDGQDRRKLTDADVSNLHCEY